jgi:hypothetical protein
VEVPIITDPELAFGTTKALPSYNRSRQRDRFEEIANSLFFRGGSIEQHGLRLKAGLDRITVYRAIWAHLKSRDPSHEHKMQGVGRMIKAWFEDPEALAKLKEHNRK